MSGGNLLAHGYFLAFVTMFVGGFLTSLTPCVYPLIPITVSLFGARGDDVPRSRAMTLAACYVAGIGVMYASLGVGFALAGKAFGTFMANPWVIVPIAVIFVAMAASMFGAFELNLPPSLATRLSSVGGKGFGGAFAMGLVGGIIAAPCTGPTLVSALTFVATTRSVAIGGSLLFTYALGMGVLFFAIAAFAVALPKSGAWMEAVKSIFGVIMLVAALYFLRNVVPWLMHYGHPTPRFLAANAAIAVFGIGLGAVHLSFHASAGTIVRKTLAVAMLVAGLFGVIAWMLTPKPLAWIYGEKAGMAAARAAHKPALLDFYADWCIPCKEMDVKTFDKVADELQRFQLVKVDCTNDDDPVVVETVKRYDAQTRPTVIVIDSDGKIVKKYDGVVTPDVLGPLLHSVH
ncbi:MAG TPA: cytochrome c biogenesis protein CcdA [Polyangia bacterium]|nr:cytochrome c biogenesis protein CcdA [Polyangia bacterium]